jgi:ankyrin repeat protein
MANESGTNALMRAMEACYDSEGLRSFFETDPGALTHRDVAGRTALHVAAAEGYAQTMQQMLAKNPGLLSLVTKVSSDPVVFLAFSAWAW